MVENFERQISLSLCSGGVTTSVVTPCDVGYRYFASKFKKEPGGLDSVILFYDLAFQFAIMRHFHPSPHKSEASS
jgi:hypothetical protein